MRAAFKLEASEARAMVDAALAKAKAIGAAQTACVTDEGGYPLVLERMDGHPVIGNDTNCADFSNPAHPRAR